MVVDVPPVSVGADDVGVLALEEALGKLYADAIRLLRCDLARLEGLAHLEAMTSLVCSRPVNCLYCRLESKNSASAVCGSQANAEISFPFSVLSGFIA